MKLALLEPVEIDGLVGLKVTVPVELLDRVTALVPSVVFGLPNWSCRWTVIVPEAIPAVTVTGAVIKTNLVGAAALTLMLLETAEGKVPEVNVKVTVPALVTTRPLKVATPLDGMAV